MFASHAQTSNEEKLSYYGFDGEVHNYINKIEKLVNAHLELIV